MALAKAGFAVRVKPVGALLPHEDIIPSHVDQLASEIQRDGMQRDPIIVDRESLAVLDGMHRLAAFQKMGFENAICCSVDYSSRGVSLGRWARAYATGEAAERGLEGAAGLKESSTSAAFASLDERKTSFAVLTSGAAYVAEGDSTLDAGWAFIRELDERSVQRGWKRSFVPEDEVDVPLQDDGTVVVLLRKVTKDEVVSAARTGRLFPCKTTMHLIDPRPVAVNFPLTWLDEATDAKLNEFLAGKEQVVAPPETLYGGRRYKEKLVFLNRA